jgi:hypothetical protein
MPLLVVSHSQPPPITNGALPPPYDVRARVSTRTPLTALSSGGVLHTQPMCPAQS